LLLHNRAESWVLKKHSLAARTKSHIKVVDFREAPLLRKKREKGNTPNARTNRQKIKIMPGKAMTIINRALISHPPSFTLKTRKRELPGGDIFQNTVAIAIKARTNGTNESAR